MSNATIILIGMATVYAGSFVGQPLFCDCDETLFYDIHSSPPWVALDKDLYDSKWASCGDELLLYGESFYGRKWRMEAKALDAGPLGEYYLEDHPDKPIVADIPWALSPFKGLSSKVIVVNLTRLKSAFPE